MGPVAPSLSVCLSGRERMDLRACGSCPSDACLVMPWLDPSLEKYFFFPFLKKSSFEHFH